MILAKIINYANDSNFMTPEQIEARFQRIEAILAISAERNLEKERRDTEQENILAEYKIAKARRDAEFHQRMDDLAKNMEILSVSMNRLAQSALDYSRWKVETDQRFNILLEEVRSINRRVDSIENKTD